MQYQFRNIQELGFTVQIVAILDKSEWIDAQIKNISNSFTLLDPCLDYSDFGSESKLIPGDSDRFGCFAERPDHRGMSNDKADPSLAHPWARYIGHKAEYTFDWGAG